MQRPTTTGRRHTRAGSITVAELIKKQPSPIRIPSREQAETEELVGDLLGVEEAGMGEGTGKRRSNSATKAAGLVTGALVLFASVAAASILAGHRPSGPGQPTYGAPVEINGSTALRPDLLSAHLRDESTSQPTTAPGETKAPAVLNAPIAADPNTAPEADEPPADAVPNVAVGQQPKIDVVRGFFELLPAQPAAAARLLSPDLLGGSTVDFVESWGTIKAITIDSTTLRPDGSVLAVVSMQEIDGRWLRLEQLFWFADTSVPRIIGTEVLSAQRS